MSNINIPSYLKNFNYYTTEVGKTFKSSKIKHTWEVTIDNKHHTIELFTSKLTGKIKVTKDGTVIFYEEEYGSLLSLPFSIDSHNCSIVQSGLSYEMRIDNHVFNHLWELEKNKLLFTSSDPTSKSFIPSMKPVVNRPLFGIGEMKVEKEESEKPIFKFEIKENSVASKGNFKFNNNNSKLNQYKHEEDARKDYPSQKSLSINNENNGNTNVLDDLFSQNTQKKEENEVLYKYNNVFDSQSTQSQGNHYDFSKIDNNNQQIPSQTQNNNESIGNNISIDSFLNNLQPNYVNNTYPSYIPYQNPSQNIEFNQQTSQFNQFNQFNQYNQFNPYGQGNNLGYVSQSMNNNNNNNNNQLYNNISSGLNPNTNLDFFDTIKPNQSNTINQNKNKNEILDDLF